MSVRNKKELVNELKQSASNLNRVRQRKDLDQNLREGGEPEIPRRSIGELVNGLTFGRERER